MCLRVTENKINKTYSFDSNFSLNNNFDIKKV